MRKMVSRRLEEILTSMQEMQEVVMITEALEERQILLGECQQAAATIGETIEKQVPDDSSMVPLLEQYCEEAYFMSEEAVVSQERLALLGSLIDRIRVLVRELPRTYQVVFMPYKAEMWDSLESVWKACQEDSRCECCVMPLPYYRYEAHEKKWNYCYDGDRFPKEVPITHYQDYSLELMRPELAYIHNPYDQENYITRIQPSFYSSELKKYVEKLVYVPYYITAGAYDQVEFPAFSHVDYMVMQSEFTKEFCKEMRCYPKMIPLGSPKIDQVIHVCQKGAELPKDWKPVLAGKKTLMLNTSIGCFLKDGEMLLDKIKYVCDIFAQQDQVALIWRPHPLLEATIQSMRPQLWQKYCNLVTYFLENKLGVFDQTPEIEKTIALSDGYIGEESTSVVNLFEAVGKPVFVFDNTIRNDFTEEEKRRVLLTDMVKCRDRLWVTSGSCNALLGMDVHTGELQLEGSVKDQFQWTSTYPSLTARGDTIFLCPGMAKMPVSYQTKTHQFYATLPEQEDVMLYQRVIAYQDRIFYLPSAYKPLMEYDIRTDDWKFHENCIQDLMGNADNTNQSITCGCAVSGEILWITASYTNRILQFSMKDGTYHLHPIGAEGITYTGITVDGEYVWLAEMQSGDVICWNQKTTEIRSYAMPDELHCRPYGPQGQNFVHGSLIDMGRWMVVAPAFSNGMVKIDKATGASTMLVSDFWQMSDREAKAYDPRVMGSGAMVKKIDDGSLLIQRTVDKAIAVIDVENETYEQFYPTLSAADYARLKKGEDGFEKISPYAAFFRKESAFFSFREFLEDLVKGRLDGIRGRQRKEFERVMANPDGTCGEKVHEFMMGVLEGEKV
ncbi:MAG: hypothetical protein RR466_02115 [Hungatella sp.]